MKKTLYVLIALALVLLCVGVSTASPTIGINDHATIIAMVPAPEVPTFCRDVSQPNAMNDYLLNANVDLASLYATMSPARPIHYPIVQYATNANTRWKVNADIWNGVREGKPLTVL